MDLIVTLAFCTLAGALGFLVGHSWSDHRHRAQGLDQQVEAAERGLHELRLLHDIGLALNATHNTVTTDRPDVKPGPTSWRVDHSRELDAVRELSESYQQR